MWSEYMQRLGSLLCSTCTCSHGRFSYLDHPLPHLCHLYMYCIIATYLFSIFTLRRIESIPSADQDVCAIVFGETPDLGFETTRGFQVLKPELEAHMKSVHVSSE